MNTVAEQAPATADDDGGHSVGNPECPSCWKSYPRYCDCGGLFHADYEDESRHRVYLKTWCDRCGERD